jgi:hypothetical protein
MGVVEPNAALMPHGPDAQGGGHFFNGLATADHLDSFSHDLKAGPEADGSPDGEFPIGSGCPSELATDVNVHTMTLCRQRMSTRSTDR